jgi:hypothetical protein
MLSSLVLGVAIFFVVRAVPLQVIQTMSISQILLIAMLVLVVIDVILLAIAMVSFHRSRLIAN